MTFARLVVAVASVGAAWSLRRSPRSRPSSEAQGHGTLRATLRAAANAAAEVTSAPSAASGAPKPHGWKPLDERRGVLCYALTRTPPEPTVSLLAEQLKAACDDWALFGDQEDLTLGIQRAYSTADEEHGWAHQQEDMTLHGAWRVFAQTGQLWQHAWIVKFDTDSFVRPSALRRSLARYNHSSTDTVCSGGVGPSATRVEGWFVGTPAALVDKLYGFQAEGKCDPRRLYEKISGHNNENLDWTRNECEEFLGLHERCQTLADASGNVLTAQPENRPAAERCTEMAQ